MKIAIISDIHANAAALEAFPESYDEFWRSGISSTSVRMGLKLSTGFGSVRTACYAGTTAKQPCKPPIYGKSPLPGWRSSPCRSRRQFNSNSAKSSPRAT
jgi:hypothetical protein